MTDEHARGGAHRPGAGVTGPAARHWAGLDLLRGAAAGLMVVNHAAVRAGPDWPSPAVDAAGFVGSFAPVLFFFLTGLGAGVQSAGRPARRGGLWAKAGLLYLADSFLWLGPGRWVGMDFLGFIAASAVLVGLLRPAPRGGAIAAAAAALWVVLRYAVGPAVRPSLPDGGWGSVVRFVLGTDVADGFSYPPGPWLAFPLAGYAIGRVVGQQGDRPAGRWLAVGGLVTAGLAGGVAAVLAGRGMVLHRWGTMSLAYFAAAVAAAGLGLVVAGLPARFGGRLTPLGLTGVRSFAVVPLHYLLLAGAVAAFGRTATTAGFAAVAGLVLAASFAGSAVVPFAAGRLASSPRRTGWVRAVGAVGAAAWVVVASGVAAGSREPAVRGAGQLAVCLLVALPAAGGPAGPSSRCPGSVSRARPTA